MWTKNKTYFLIHCTPKAAIYHCTSLSARMRQDNRFAHSGTLASSAATTTTIATTTLHSPPG
ncbi:hypothetical protein E2C01_062247 [Portunus trituberculatus]|uniref:Uncharacterized protein n=1 Tax=Portunus trituberculatus TaxID=210409 RepID=A0A5B7HFL1_PORTR|nr:hypothetical protein [Portunus trituberculatus]